MKIKAGDPGAHLLMPFINDIKLSGCTEADTDAGMALVYEECVDTDELRALIVSVHPRDWRARMLVVLKGNVDLRLQDEDGSYRPITAEEVHRMGIQYEYIPSPHNPPDNPMYPQISREDYPSTIIRGKKTPSVILMSGLRSMKITDPEAVSAIKCVLDDPIEPTPTRKQEFADAMKSLSERYGTPLDKLTNRELIEMFVCGASALSAMQEEGIDVG